MSEKATFIVVLVLVCLMIFALCILSEYKWVDHGTVIDKDFIPAHTTTQMMPVIINNRTALQPRYIFHPDVYRILVDDGERREWWTVTKIFYDSVEIGDTVDRRKSSEKEAGVE